MHGLTNLARLNDERRLHSFADRYKIMVDGRDSKQRRDKSADNLLVTTQRSIYLVCQYDVVVAVVYRLLSILAQTVKSFFQSLACSRWLRLS